MKETIVVTDGYTLNPGDLAWKNIEQFGRVQVYDRSTPQETIDRCREATVIITNKTPITRAVISAAPNLRVITVAATGYNIVDTVAAREAGIPVCNVPGYGTDSVAQHTFALLLELVSHVGLNASSVASGEWVSSADFCFSKKPVMEISGKVLGIVGYGRIGQKVAEVARAFGMKVVYSSRSVSGSDPSALSVKELFEKSDFVTLHCPLTSANAGFVNAALLARMKPGSFLINTARGQLINEGDLANALNDGRIAGAALDVLSVEPPPSTNPLLTARNCIITPHTAWMSFEARQRIMQTTFDNINSALRGTPINVVN